MPHGSNNTEVLSVLLILLVIVTVNNARNRHRLTKSALVHPKFSPWINLLRNADDGSFLTITGFSRFAFNELVKVLFDADGTHSVGSKRGRPELIDNIGSILLLPQLLLELTDLVRSSLLFQATADILDGC